MQNKAELVKKFIRLLRHTKGEWRGKPFNLLGWQEHVTDKIFGTITPEGYRQYKTAFIEIPKKNGKSEYLASIALFLLFADGEKSGEIYSCANDREQASIVFNIAKSMIEMSPTLARISKIIPSQKRIVVPATNSVYAAISAEAYTKHGLSPSAVLFDEIHAAKNREFHDTMVEGTDAARKQQLVCYITTAGEYDKNHIGWQKHDYAKRVLNGTIDDPSFLPIIYTCNEKKWDSEKEWEKANPALDDIFDIDNLRKHYREVKNDPARLANFKRFRLNIWVNQVKSYIPIAKWDKLGSDYTHEDLAGRECYGGLDLSTKLDLSCFCLIFPPTSKGERWHTLAKFYLPENDLAEKGRKDNVPYIQWQKEGHLTATPGNSVDYAFIRKDINEYAKMFTLKEIAYDPWSATQLVTELDNLDGMKMSECWQGFRTMSAPTQELLKMIVSKEITHDRNPVMTWCLQNLSVRTNPDDFVKPDKSKSKNRIDGAVALIMAIQRSIVAKPVIPQKSVYDKRGIVAF